jgi:hypothetical protein
MGKSLAIVLLGLSLSFTATFATALRISNLVIDETPVSVLDVLPCDIHHLAHLFNERVIHSFSDEAGCNCSNVDGHFWMLMMAMPSIYAVATDAALDAALFAVEGMNKSVSEEAKAWAERSDLRAATNAAWHAAEALEASVLLDVYTAVFKAVREPARNAARTAAKRALASLTDASAADLGYTAYTVSERIALMFVLKFLDAGDKNIISKSLLTRVHDQINFAAGTGPISAKAWKNFRSRYFSDLEPAQRQLLWLDSIAALLTHREQKSGHQDYRMSRLSENGGISIGDFNVVQLRMRSRSKL